MRSWAALDEPLHFLVQSQIFSVLQQLLQLYSKNFASNQSVSKQFKQMLLTQNLIIDPGYT